MQYKRFQDIELSALGFGCMRLPKNSDAASDINEELAAEMFKYAFDHGVNYFDTAWGYHDHASEPVVGKLLKAFPRDRFYLATKFPGYDLANFDKVSEIFEEQLKRLDVEYFDFYLCHNVTEKNIDAYLDPKYGVMDFLREQMKAGRIRHLGFSCHGQQDVLERFVEAYRDDIEFCQIQLNYLDWSLQKADRKVEYLKSCGIPVWVMEPVRGGKLADIDADYREKLDALRPGRTPASWALRFAIETEGVGMVLSGMSDMEQVIDNVATASDVMPLTDEEKKALADIAESMIGRTALPCTGCAYCTEYCPQQINIPKFMTAYNDMCYSKGGFVPMITYTSAPEGHRPDDCLGCGACAAVCPQNIDIPGMMSDFTAKYKEYFNK